MGGSEGEMEGRWEGARDLAREADGMVEDSGRLQAETERSLSAVIAEMDAEGDGRVVVGSYGRGRGARSNGDEHEMIQSTCMRLPRR